MISRQSIVNFLLVAFATITLQESHAQYYTWGSDAASLKWENIKTPEVRLIYPDTVDALTRRTLHYIKSTKDDISFGFTYPALKIPFIMHPENFQSNGMVMWLPKRIEFITSPAVESYSMPWIKQLVAHEYRHAVQYNNLNRGVVRVLSYIMGQQGSAAGLLFLPLPIIEGDAVKMETSMSSFGRGLQPSFTMGYRAIGEGMLNRKNVDKWFCGSYREYIPDHYKLGYQIVDYSYTHYQENIWDRVAFYSVRNPYVISTTAVALNKYYDTNTAKLVRASFADLLEYWNSLPERNNSTQTISHIDTTNYTTYSNPVALEDQVIALKSDYSKPNRFVRTDLNGENEERISYVGYVSTRPSIGGERVWWSEYRRSMLFEQRVNSTLCYMDLDDGKTHTVSRFRNVLYPTAIDNSNDKLAYVEYAPNGQYTIVEMELYSDKIRSSKDFDEISRTPIKFPTELHGLAWDDKTEELYFIATDDSGMWLGVRDMSSKDGFRRLRDGVYISLSDLSAKGGKLYFGSIESGYDELHCYDIASGVETRLSESKFGSFDPSAPVGGYNYATTYDKHGYHLARQRVDSLNILVEPTSLPQNIVNPKRLEWDLINLDTVQFSAIDSIASHANHRSKKYNKAAKLINIHSWMPASFNPFELTDEQRLSMSIGATVISQNLLSSAEGYASYGYNSTEGSLFSAGIKYDGLGFDLELDATYGGNQIVYSPLGVETKQQEYYAFTTGVSLPMYFQRGYHTRSLTLSSSWNYSNGLVYDLDKLEVDKETNQIFNYKTIGFNEGLHKLSFGLGFSDVVRSAQRDAMVPWGYSISAGYATSPSENNISDLLSLYGKVITPGLFPYNSFSVAGCYQNSYGGYSIDGTVDFEDYTVDLAGINLMSFQSVALLPRGFSSTDIINNRYASMSFNYQFPICYPEGGIGSIIYFRRIRANFGFDAARFDNYYTDKVDRIYSYGGDLILDINPLRMPDASTTSIKISLYQPSVGKFSYSFGVALPF
ncbi:MAG: hypothetical protein R3Y39_05125 [Rikenellaceae bacterium]